ncbi:MAG: VCBS repeat-containing protein [candidate division NC10 bacterium]|nr:VCBS repeat-containing protein [candidate division NC10 bacterium]
MRKHQRWHSALPKGGIFLVVSFWLTAANAQPPFTPIILNDPTPQGSSRFGAALAGVGDVNGDGTPDLVVAGGGQAFVFSGADRTLLRILDDPTPEAGALGEAVAGVGDVNGDGTPDLLVGASGQIVGGNTGQGQAFVFSGADGSLLHTLDDPTPQASAGFGTAVAGVGDVNGDGTPDLLVGTPFQDAGPNIGQGRAFVFSGADGNLLHTLDDPTPQAFAEFGFAVAGVGDVNGDGTPDLLVGARHQTVGGNDIQGQAFVFSGADGNLLHTLDSPTPQDGQFGVALAGVGDVNGDGTPDLLVGAPLQTVGGDVFQGQAFVFSGADGSLLYTLNDPTPTGANQFGFALAAVGDVNGDGTPDVLVGAPVQVQGRAFVFSGADGNLLHTLTIPPGPGPLALGFGGAVAAVGDVDGDGTPDLLVGEPGFKSEQGRAILFVSTPLIIEVSVDILPGAINPTTPRVIIPVAILTTRRFVATKVDPLSVRFGPTGATEVDGQGQFQDINGDGKTDLLLHFRTGATGVACGDTEASLTGKTFDGVPIHGSDSFVTVGCP